jgi:hypothetical protein
MRDYHPLEDQIVPDESTRDDPDAIIDNQVGAYTDYQLVTTTEEGTGGGVSDDDAPITDPVDQPKDDTKDTPVDSKDPKPVVTTRSGRVSRSTRYLDYYISYEANVESSWNNTVFDFGNPLALAASTDPDEMYYHQILWDPDKHQLIDAVPKEIQGHNDNDNWELVPRSSVPAHIKIHPTVWARRRKRNLTDGTVYKWKARINVDGSTVSITGTLKLPSHLGPPYGR